MKKAYTPFLFLASLFLFASCEEDYVSPIENTATFQPKELTSLSQIKETVLFQFDYQEVETGERYGFIINHQGKLMSYTIENEEQANQLPIGGECEPSEVDYLHLMSRTVAQLSEEDVLNFYNLSERVAANDLSSKVADENQKSITTISTFKQNINYSENMGGGCGEGSCGDEVQAELVYDNLVLKMEGAFNQENTGVEATEIVEWVNSLQSEAGL